LARYSDQCKVFTAPHPLLTLAVPLHVDAKAAQNWDEAH
jgi:DNA polymerase I-like protein with 3'-5' exonuclease and polymerase domains